jgi:hypothetical protein
MRSYYPEVTYSQVRALLIELVNDRKLNCTYCEEIEKRVFWKENYRGKIWPDGLVGNLDMKDEFNTYFSRTWDD